MGRDVSDIGTGNEVSSFFRSAENMNSVLLDESTVFVRSCFRLAAHRLGLCLDHAATKTII